MVITPDQLREMMKGRPDDVLILGHCDCGPSPVTPLPLVKNEMLIIPEHNPATVVSSFFLANEIRIIKSGLSEFFTDGNFNATHSVAAEKKYELILSQYCQRDNGTGKIMMKEAMASVLKQNERAFFGNVQALLLALLLTETHSPLFLPSGVMIISPDDKKGLYKDSGGQYRVPALFKPSPQHVLPHLLYLDGPVPEQHYFLMFREIK